MSSKPDDFVLGGHFRPLEYHRMLLDDAVRVDAYRRAIHATVNRGDVVLDLGTGTGILALMAARAGARVHAVESGPVARLARSVIAHNQLEDRVTVHHADIRTLDIPEPVDVVISDFMGRTIVDDGMLQAVDAAARWLKPNGVFIPGQVMLRAAPVGDFTIRAIDLFAAQPHGFDFSAAVPYALNYCYSAALPAESVVAQPASVVTVDPLQSSRPSFRFNLNVSAERDSQLRAIALWFRAEMADDVVLDTGPGRPTHWGQYLLPLPPGQVEKGDVIDAEVWLGVPSQPAAPTLASLEQDAAWYWRGEIRRQTQPDIGFELSSEQRMGERSNG